MLQNFIKKRTFETVLYEWELYKKQYTSKYDVIDKFPRRIFLIHVFFNTFMTLKSRKSCITFLMSKYKIRTSEREGVGGKYIKDTVYEI